MEKISQKLASLLFHITQPLCVFIFKLGLELTQRKIFEHLSDASCGIVVVLVVVIHHHVHRVSDHC